MHTDLKQLQALCENYTILYVEDDIQTQEEVTKTLKRIFKEVFVANDGLIGLELFKEHLPNIVMTDIQMPHLNGLDMARSIKEIAPNVPIVVATAFNEEQYFLKAIENGIDSFLLKPIDKEKLFQAIHKNITQVDYYKKAKELEEHKKMDDINRASEESIKNLSDLFPFPTLFYKENNLIFINTAAKQTLEAIPLDILKYETSFVSQFYISKDKKQKIKIPTTNGLNRVYRLFPNALFIGVDSTLIQAYIFIDITLSEYRKLKLDNYALYAHNLISNKPKKPSLDKSIEQPSIPISKDSLRNETERALLRKSINHKITASEFLQELGVDFLDELEEFNELQDSLINFTYDFKETQERETLFKISTIIVSYAATMEKLYEFKDLGYALRNITLLLNTLEATNCNYKKLSIYLACISEDIFAWYANIFLNQSAVDIHYLDSSLLSSCLQMEAEFRDGNSNDLGDDLELF